MFAIACIYINKSWKLIHTKIINMMIYGGGRMRQTKTSVGTRLLHVNLVYVRTYEPCGYIAY